MRPGGKNIFFDHGLGETLDTIELVRKVRICEFSAAVAFVLDRPLSDIQPAANNGARPASALVVDGVEELARARLEGTILGQNFLERIWLVKKEVISALYANKKS